MRVPIDVERAAAQHSAYEAVLRSLGVSVVQAPAAPEQPDAVFIEDTAVVLDELAVMTRPGAAARRGELEGVATVLAKYRPLFAMDAPATLDGGDVMRVGGVLYVGRSGRTNEQGIEQLSELVAPFGYRVVAVEFTGCLHLKSAVTALTDDVLLLNPEWVSPTAFPGLEAISIDVGERMAANALRIGENLVYSSQYPRTGALLAERGLRLSTVDCSELAKAEGAVTCCSLVFDQ
jgi:dimethylargininase